MRFPPRLPQLRAQAPRGAGRGGRRVRDSDELLLPARWVPQARHSRIPALLGSQGLCGRPGRDRERGRSAETLTGAGVPRRVQGVLVRTVRRWLGWWSTVFVLHRLWSEARAMFARPVAEALLPASLLERFSKPSARRPSLGVGDFYSAHVSGKAGLLADLDSGGVLNL